MGAVHKGCRNFFGHFWYLVLPNFYLLNNILQHRNLRPPPPKIFRRLLWVAPCLYLHPQIDFHDSKKTGDKNIAILKLKCSHSRGVCIWNIINWKFFCQFGFFIRNGLIVFNCSGCCQFPVLNKRRFGRLYYIPWFSFFLVWSYFKPSVVTVQGHQVYFYQIFCLQHPFNGGSLV